MSETKNDIKSLENYSIIRAMEVANVALHGIPIEYQNEEYKEISAKIEAFIAKHCIHDIIYDSIDIHPECCKTIRYCTKCFKTFE